MIKIRDYNAQMCLWNKIVATLLLLIVMITLLVSCRESPYDTTPSIESIPEFLSCDTSALNYRQSESPYLLHVYKNQLYIYDRSSTVISTCKGKTVSSVVTVSSYAGNFERLGGWFFIDSLFYFCCSLDGKYYVKAIDVITLQVFDEGVSTFSPQYAPFGDVFYSPLDNDFFLQFDSSGTTIKQALDGSVETYTIDNAQIIKKLNKYDMRYGELRILDNNGNLRMLSEDFDRIRYCLYQLTDGRIIIYILETFGIRRGDVLAWIIDSDGLISPLFSGVTGELIESAANVCRNKLFISFMRYEKWDKFFSRKFKDDNLSGTWVIDLETYESTKISNSFYKGLYVFGDELICVDSNNVLNCIGY